MNITDIRVRKVSSATGKMKAVVSITIDDAFVVHDIKVIEGQEKLFIAMPSRKTPDGEFKDIAHPINASTREELETKILAEYEKAMAEESSTEE
ncbi:MAG: septation regulator SpoVG [Ruminococcaceae bacterium]|nr:septation regulator SpoVG [Oscillospiraceae bacterium]